MFTVQTIFLAENRTDAVTYDQPAPGPEGDPARALWAEFIGSRPPVFREKLPFLREVELEWSAAPGGVALASTHNAEGPCSMGILLGGGDAEADQMMLSAWRTNVLAPLMGEEQAAQVDGPERPLLINVMFPAAGMDAPALRLTATALASAFFRPPATVRR